MRVSVRLIGESSTDTQLISPHTCAYTQKPYCNLYRHFYFRCYSDESKKLKKRFYLIKIFFASLFTVIKNHIFLAHILQNHKKSPKLKSNYDFFSSSFVLLIPFNFSNANIKACVPNFCLPSAAKIS